jgi:hexulose-6-phosphate isomerase
MINRRTLLAASAALAAGLSANELAAEPEKPKKAVLWDMLPGSQSVADRFKLARDAGFEGVEAPPIRSLATCEQMRGAAEKEGIRIHSVIYGGWDPPLTHPDPAARERSLDNARDALRSAKALGAEDILLVPGLVDAKTRYQEAYQRAQEGIRRLIPLAEQLQVLICLEEVWNNFLLSPLEYAHFIDSFRSQWVHAYFDVGNVVIFGWPEDWIRTVGKRIRKVHLKDYKGGPGLFGGHGGDWANLGEGSINWPEVRKAFAEIGYTGFMTTELHGGDAAYLRDVSARVDRLLLSG